MKFITVISAAIEFIGDAEKSYPGAHFVQLEHCAW